MGLLGRGSRSRGVKTIAQVKRAAGPCGASSSEAAQHVRPPSQPVFYASASVHGENGSAARRSSPLIRRRVAASAPDSSGLLLAGEANRGAAGGAGLRLRHQPAGAARRLRRPGLRRQRGRRGADRDGDRRPRPGRRGRACRRSCAACADFAARADWDAELTRAVRGARAGSGHLGRVPQARRAERSCGRSPAATSTPTTRCCRRSPASTGPATRWRTG